MTIYTIQATTDARARLESYFNEIVDRRKTGELTDVSQYASRWCEQAARLSITLHAGLHGADAHKHPMAVETVENGIKLAKWFSSQQLTLLARSRRTAAAKKEDEVLELLEKNLTHKGRDFATARDVHRARIVTTADAAASLLARMEQDGYLLSEEIRPEHGGKTTLAYRSAAGRNPVHR